MHTQTCHGTFRARTAAMQCTKRLVAAQWYAYCCSASVLTTPAARYRSKVPRVVPPLLQGRDGSQWAPPGPAAARGDRPAVRKLSFIVGCEPCGRKRKAAASPSSTEDESDSRGTEVSSASVFRWVEMRHCKSAWCGCWVWIIQLAGVALCATTANRISC